jgi:hypothetical protein
MKYAQPHCNPMEHDWEVEEVCGNGMGSSISTDEIILKFRCRKCNASIEGEVKR